MMLAHFVSAQNTTLDIVTAELVKINNTFDSSLYLAFDLDINFNSDSAGVIVETDQMSGNYVLNAKNMYYHMGGTEYIQTDSFSYTIYPEEKMMVMAKNFVEKSSSVFPLRAFVDSILHYYGTNYNISLDSVDIDSTEYFKRISFTVKNNSSGVLDSTFYTKFLIEYNPASYLPQKFAFGFMETKATPDSIPIFHDYFKTIIMDFSKYHAFINTEIFDDNNYIIYNRQRKIYEPNEKYKEYRFITAGFENEDEDAPFYREVPADGN